MKPSLLLTRQYKKYTQSRSVEGDVIGTGKINFHLGLPIAWEARKEIMLRRFLCSINCRSNHVMSYVEMKGMSF